MCLCAWMLNSCVVMRGLFVAAAVVCDVFFVWVACVRLCVSFVVCFCCCTAFRAVCCVCVCLRFCLSCFCVLFVIYCVLLQGV